MIESLLEEFQTLVVEDKKLAHEITEDDYNKYTPEQKDKVYEYLKLFCELSKFL